MEFSRAFKEIDLRENSPSHEAHPPLRKGRRQCWPPGSPEPFVSKNGPLEGKSILAKHEAAAPSQSCYREALCTLSSGAGTGASRSPGIVLPGGGSRKGLQSACIVAAWLLRPSQVKFQHHLHSPEIRPYMEWLTLSSALLSAIHVRACMLSRSSCVHLFFTLWTVACQAPLSMGFSRQEYWNGWPFPSP